MTGGFAILGSMLEPSLLFPENFPSLSYFKRSGLLYLNFCVAAYLSNSAFSRANYSSRALSPPHMQHPTIIPMNNTNTMQAIIMKAVQSITSQTIPQAKNLVSDIDLRFNYASYNGSFVIYANSKGDASTAKLLFFFDKKALANKLSPPIDMNDLSFGV